MFARFSIKKQFIYTFIVVLTSSMISVLITYLLLFYGLTRNNVLYEANHHENNSRLVVDYINKKGLVTLNPSFQSTLEKDTPIQSLHYQILDQHATFLYGNWKEQILKSKSEIHKKINTYDNSKNIITRYEPILDTEGDLQGVLLIHYPLKLTAKNDSIALKNLIMLIFLASPFLFIILYSLLFGAQFAKNMNTPFNLIIHAADQIKANNLDFEIGYHYNNEIGHVIHAFDEMRITLKQTLNRQWQLEQERRDMISALSHDLKTPLTIIKGHVELLQEGSCNNPERLLKYLTIVENNTNRAVALVEDLNLLSKVERTDFKLNPEYVNLLDFSTELELEYQTLCNTKSIHLVFNRQNLTHANVIIDSLRVSQIIHNLLINSLRFTPRDGTIFINLSQNDDKIYFSISDSGKGFNTQDFQNVFNKFYQGDPSRSEEKGHSGLGLYICKNLVQKHNGQIIASNNINGGAQIDFYIKELTSTLSKY